MLARSARCARRCLASSSVFCRISAAIGSSPIRLAKMRPVRGCSATGGVTDTVAAAATSAAGGSLDGVGASAGGAGAGAAAVLASSIAGVRRGAPPNSRSAAARAASAVGSEIGLGSLGRTKNDRGATAVVDVSRLPSPSVGRISPCGDAHLLFLTSTTNDTEPRSRISPLELMSWKISRDWLTKSDLRSTPNSSRLVATHLCDEQSPVSAHNFFSRRGPPRQCRSIAAGQSVRACEQQRKPCIDIGAARVGLLPSRPAHGDLRRRRREARGRAHRPPFQKGHRECRRESIAGAALVHPLAAQHRHDGEPVAMCQHAPAVGLLDADEMGGSARLRARYPSFCEHSPWRWVSRA